jgi:hypothetical protein
MNRNQAILLFISMLAVILIYMKFRTELFQVNFPLKDTILKGVTGEQGPVGPQGNQGPQGAAGPQCKNIISNLETRGYLNLGGTSSAADDTIDSQLVLKGQASNNGRNFYKLKITDYSDTKTYPIMVGNNPQDADFYLEKDNDKFKMVLKGDLKINGSLTIKNDNNLDRFINTGSLFYNLAPKGIIAAFHTDTTIPALWAMCDGSTIEGFTTPDLRGKFIMGGNAPGETRHNDASFDGETKFKTGEIKLTKDNMPQHDHTMSDVGPHGHNISSNSAGAHGHDLIIGGSNNTGDTPGNFVRRGGQASGRSFNTNSAGGHQHNITAADAGGHKHVIDSVGKNEKINIMPSYLALIYIIKYK